MRKIEQDFCKSLYFLRSQIDIDCDHRSTLIVITDRLCYAVTDRLSLRSQIDFCDHRSTFIAITDRLSNAITDRLLQARTGFHCDHRSTFAITDRLLRSQTDFQLRSQIDFGEQDCNYIKQEFHLVDWEMICMAAVETSNCQNYFCASKLLAILAMTPPNENEYRAPPSQFATEKHESHSSKIHSFLAISMATTFKVVCNLCT